ncbi:diguanylate cyclase [Spirulina subsalsa FACHB-351]|uniref:Diguanylate cyclase n=1 Tax=Spirulina subsalsa FACHB-351 TaxID=234711 RepID=A0ABT3L3W5_9CYAN|nr:diguanylate cyclase [Spirulina subsalsa]MCW6036202.1 diguanylate cyclase [Spirulina subsalsa FACHB-351]
MLKYCFVLFLSCAIAFGVAATLSLPLSLPWSPQPTLAKSPSPSPLETVTLQLKWRHQFQFAGYYAAKAQGYYEQAGLDVQMREIPENGSPVEAVLKGEAEFGVAGSDLVLLRNQGHPVVALAAIYQHSPSVIIARRQPNLDHIHDLVEKRVMIEDHAAELIAYLKSEGIALDQLIQVPHSFTPLSLINRRVDAMSGSSTDEPFFLNQVNIPHIIFNPRVGGIDFYGDTLFTTEAQIKRYPQRVKAFLNASLKGWEYALEHPEEIIELIYTEYSPRHSRAHLRYEAEASKRLILSDVVEIGYMNPGRWHYILKVYHDLGFGKGYSSLAGFIYERYPQPNLTWVYLVFITILSILGFVSWIALRFYQLNNRIRQEVNERMETERSLRALEKRYRFLVESSPFPIVISEFETGKICYINPKAAQTFKVKPNRAIGHLTQNFYVYPEDRNCILKSLKKQGFIQDFETKLFDSKRKFFWANISGTLINFDGNLCLFITLIDITQRKQLEEQLSRLAMTDELTGLYNRRYFFQRGREELNNAVDDVSLLVIDIDFFKKVNDTFGHDVGDLVLQSVAELLKSQATPYDLLGRLGGEEFALLLPHTRLQEATYRAKNICEIIAQEKISVHCNSIQITVSIGVATTSPHDLDIRKLFKGADLALYEAKNSGRNCVVQLSRVESPD